MRSLSLPRVIVFTTLLFSAALFVACGEGTVATRPSDIIFPDTAVSYQRHVQPFMNLACAFSGCHSDGDRIPLSSYITLYNTPGLIIIGKPESSRLNQVLEGKLSHNGAFQNNINDNHRRGMSTWVKEGCKNN